LVNDGQKLPTCPRNTRANLSVQRDREQVGCALKVENLLGRFCRAVVLSGVGAVASYRAPVVSNSSYLETLKAMGVELPLPQQKLIKGKRVFFASFIKADQTRAYAGDNLRFATDNPAFGVRGRQVIPG